MVSATVSGLVEVSGIHARTIKSILNGRSKPHPRTLHKLAVALDASADEFFRPAPAELHPGNGADTESKVAALLQTDKAVILRAVVDALYANCAADQS
jgi:transcriptional regulator with XRE-family HTH domain